MHSKRINNSRIFVYRVSTDTVRPEDDAAASDVWRLRRLKAQAIQRLPSLVLSLTDAQPPDATASNATC